jgi:ribosomal protein L44E
VSRSTADFTKHGRTQMEKAAKRQRRAAHRKHIRSQGGSDSDATNENGGDSSSGTDDEASSSVSGESRKLRKSISLTELRGMPSQQRSGGGESEVGKIKKERDHENKLMNQRAVRERARGQREHERQRVGGGSVPYVSPFGNSPTTKSLEYCYSCLMKTDISSDGDRKLWKRRVLGFGSNGTHCFLSCVVCRVSCVVSFADRTRNTQE